MKWITVFQLIHRCLLLDASEQAPPRAIQKDLDRILDEAGRKAAALDSADQAERPGGPGGAGAPRPE